MSEEDVAVDDAGAANIGAAAEGATATAVFDMDVFEAEILILLLGLATVATGGNIVLESGSAPTLS